MHRQAGEPLEALCDFHRQGRAARAAQAQGRKVALLDSGHGGQRDPHGRHAGEHGDAPGFDVAHDLFGVEARPQQDFRSRVEPAQQHHAEPINMEERQHAHYPLARGDGPLRLLPDVVHREHGGEITVREHGALGQPGGAAGILQERDVIDAGFGKIAGCRVAFQEPREGELLLVLGKRRERNRRRPPGRIVADDEPVDVPGGHQLLRRGEQGGEVHGDQRPRAAVGELVHQRALHIERAQMRHPRAGIERAEERDRVKERVRQIKRHRRAGPDAEPLEAFGRAPRTLAELAIADRMAAILDRRTVAMAGDGAIEDARDGSKLDRCVPAGARRIGLLPRIGTRRGHDQAAFSLSDANPRPSAASFFRSEAGSRFLSFE